MDLPIPASLSLRLASWHHGKRHTAGQRQGGDNTHAHHRPLQHGRGIRPARRHSRQLAEDLELRSVFGNTDGVPWAPASGPGLEQCTLTYLDPTSLDAIRCGHRFKTQFEGIRRHHSKGLSLCTKTSIGGLLAQESSALGPADADASPFAENRRGGHAPSLQVVII